MSDITGTTRLQTKFLRSFLQNPAGPPPQDWPKPALLRRWLRRPTFRAAFTSLRQSVRFQLSTQLLFASLQSAQHLQTALDPSQSLSPDHRRLCLDLLKLAHRRPRLVRKSPKDDPDDLTFEEQVNLLKHPSVSSEEAIAFFRGRLDDKDNLPFDPHPTP